MAGGRNIGNPFASAPPQNASGIGGVRKPQLPGTPSDWVWDGSKMIPPPQKTTAAAPPSSPFLPPAGALPSASPIPEPTTAVPNVPIPQAKEAVDGLRAAGGGDDYADPMLGGRMAAMKQGLGHRAYPSLDYVLQGIRY